MSKKIGYTSISHDIIYVLPFNNEGSMKDSILKTIAIKPDRMSLYSYPHVPWLKGNGQRGFNKKELPTPVVKRTLYEKAKKLLLMAGYLEVEMDHFALENDELYLAFQHKKLHRNFMGYTTHPSKFQIGLGVSAISDSWLSFRKILRILIIIIRF